MRLRWGFLAVLISNKRLHIVDLLAPTGSCSTLIYYVKSNVTVLGIFQKSLKDL